jgi:hypothetical protein
MTTINKGRHSAAPGADGKVLFLIGMRVNSLWRVHKWLPVAMAMPRMLIELQRNPDMGLVGKPRTMVSGRVVMVWQYWNSFEQLAEYARASERSHLPAWRAFNKQVRDNGTVGIFHETITLSDDGVETVYGNMPTIGLAAVTGLVPASQRGQTAAQRLGKVVDDTPPVDPY